MSLHPEGRFEWERIIRRIPLPPTAKLVALLLATYGTREGTRVRPGVRRLAAVSGLADRTVKRALARLRKDGLIEEMVSGSRAGTGRTSEYRLTLPEDLIERGLLDPDEVNQGTPVSPGQGTFGGGAGDTRDRTRADWCHPITTGPQQEITHRSRFVLRKSTRAENDGTDEDDERRYAAAQRELQYLPDFGLSWSTTCARHSPATPTTPRW